MSEPGFGWIKRLTGFFLNIRFKNKGTLKKGITSIQKERYPNEKPPI